MHVVMSNTSSVGELLDRKSVVESDELTDKVLTQLRHIARNALPIRTSIKSWSTDASRLRSVFQLMEKLSRNQQQLEIEACIKVESEYCALMVVELHRVTNIFF